MLCGHPPFCGQDDNTIKSKILHSKLVFPQKDFKNISSEAINFLKKLLTYLPDKRFSAEQALNDMWLNDESKHSNIGLSNEIIGNLERH
jgi:calcium-dependent protein kinase